MGRENNQAPGLVRARKIPFYHSLKFKTLAGIFALSILPLAILGFYSLNTLSLATRDLLIKANLQAIQQVKIEVDNFVRHYVDLINVLKNDRRLGAASGETIDSMLKSMDDEFEFLDALVLLQPDGTMIARSGGEAGMVGEAERKALENPDEVYVAEGRFLIRQPLSGEPGSPLLISTVSFFELRKQLDRVSQGTTFNICLTTADGINVLQQKDFPATLVKRLISSPYGAYDYIQGGIPQVAVVLPVLRYGLKVVVTQNTVEMYSLVASARRTIFSTIAVAGVLALIYGIIFSLQLSLPIITIADKANEISEGNLSVRVNLKRSDEIGFLAYCFNNMATQILKKIFELSALFQISQIISHASSYQEVLDKILVQLIKLFGARRGSIMLLSDKKDTLRLKSVKIYRPEDGSIVGGDLQEQIEMRCGEGIAGHVVKSGIPVLSIDCENDPRFKKYIGSSGMKAPKSLISVPLIVKDKPFGVINLSDRKDDTSFTTGDMELLLTISTQMAISLDNSKLYEMAIRDGLTGLFIYRYFQIRLEEELIRSRRYEDPLALMMIDVDFFKKFNDQYGHQQGDIVLRETAQLIQMTVRSIDVVCRYGGEEFVVILPNTTSEQALILAERLRHKVEEYPFPGQENNLKVTISIGLAEFPRMASDKGEFINRADIALYESKKQGRNRCTVFSGEMKSTGAASE
ncbi:MAG: diguanylate cyclase [Candidatus Wallbacteria bacterium]|nr:diguanylate cyclase [Candidatus Wallbacteria bacterium]